ncbi:TPA: hypothetical protein CPT81_04650 [Candidatus Gastranaerophilales bacterium HUM_20]|nr:MAG: hypothetical protein BHW55_02050 [Candidatus Melainabacteria bacterium 35_41]CDE88825.1 unknown [Clostridium sp. CAG:729]DAB21752.1 MAG TPA: hypothetical protein CPT81_04650 [Candidatus Gastranaerophilales bacterium HUM_20]
MKYYGTKNNKDYGFYEEQFENAIEITDKYWSDLLDAQCDGKIIIPYENSVIAVYENEYSFIDNKWVKLSEEEAQAKQLTIQNAIRLNEIQAELDELDRKRIRAIAEPSLKDENTTWLEYYNSQISELRNEYTQLSS